MGKFCILLVAVIAMCVGCVYEPHPEMVFVEGGTYRIGCLSEMADADESPMAEVSVQSFYISQYEITQREWVRVMGYNNSMFVSPKNPVENITWYEAQEFVAKLSQLTGDNYRLPTEEEWEWAARGGKLSKNYTYSGSDNLHDVAKADMLSPRKPSRVGQFLPNELGIYDMTGNVHEWCQNYYDSLYYAKLNALKGVNIPTTKDEVVVRGGSWTCSPKYCRITNRNHCSPDIRNCDIGLRIVRD